MLNGNFVCRKLCNNPLDENPFRDGYDKKRAVVGLSKMYRKIIEKSIEENKVRDEIKKKMLDDETDKIRKKKQGKI